MTVNIHGLTKAENELLKAARNFFPKEREINAVILKLNEEIGLDAGTIGFMVGLSGSKVAGIIRSQKPTTKKSKKVEKPDPEKVQEFIETTVSANSSDRLAIHVNSESDRVTRAAYAMAKHIEHEMSPGDKWLAVASVAKQFEISVPQVSAANKILLDHNWVEMHTPGNFRLGYLVK